MVGLVTVVVGSGQLPFDVGAGPGRPGPGRQRGPGRRPDPDPVERGRRAHGAARPRDPGHAGLRQGRQHLGPDRRQGDPGHRRRQRLDAVVRAGRHARSTSSGRARPSGAWSVDGEIKDYTLDVPAIMRVAGRRRHADEDPRRARRPRRAAEVDGLHPRAGRVPRRQHDRHGDGPARPDPERRHAQAAQPAQPEDHGPRARPGAAARPPGPGVAARRAAPRLRPRRPRRRQGHAPDLPLHARDEEDPRADRPPATSSPPGRRTGSTSRPRGRARSARTW